MLKRIRFNSPVVLSITALSLLIYSLNWLTHGYVNQFTALGPEFKWDAIPRTITYALSHGNLQHLVSNLSIFLLIGPILEERHGWRFYALMTGVCVIFTALFHIILFNDYLIGLSGVVFMNVALASFTNVKKGEIPLTFIIVLVFFLGNEMVESLRDDQISQFAHLIGGTIGSLFGFIASPKSSFKASANE